MENNNEIEISIIKGEKLFNKNTPFAINLSSPQSEDSEKKCNADLICVIDISGSMMGQKIYQVKESLKTLLNLMDEKDRICLILFNEKGENYYKLNYLNKDTKKNLIEKINQIDAYGGTNILSGLEIAIDVLKKECHNEKSVSSILLLSDGCDNYMNDIQLADSLKRLTKGFGLSFTLNTFGYGNDHDEKIMNKLANLRDGSFFFVEDYSKITEYFVSILGGGVSVISKKVDLKLEIINNNCKIVKVYGEDNLYFHESNEKYFKTTMLQFMCGKEYTFVLELFVDEQKVQINEEILKVEIIYEDISQNNKIFKKEKKYNFCLNDLNFVKANDEYIRAYVYHVLDEAMKLRQNNNYEESKKKLEEIEKWILNNYKGSNKNYIKDIQSAKGLFSNNEFDRLRSLKTVNCSIQENAFKRTGVTMNFCNFMQLKMLRSIQDQMPLDTNQNPILPNTKPVGVTQNLRSFNYNFKKDCNKDIGKQGEKKNKLNQSNSIGPKFGKNIDMNQPNINKHIEEDDDL